MKKFIMLFMVRSAFALFDESTYNGRSIIQPNNLEPIAVAQGSTLYDWSRVVARMESGGAGFCTGFRVAENLFMTNYHCAIFKPCSEVNFHIGYEPAVPASLQGRFQCKAILSQEEKLDYALYDVNPSVNQHSYPVATLSEKLLVPEQDAFMTGYPGTFTKQIDRSQQCRIMTAEPTHFENKKSITHSCDSTSGSSGGPLMDKSTGQVLALHWGGTGNEQYNHAIRMRDILADIKSKVPLAYDLLTIAR